ncbi:Hydrogen peroxide-inducible protein activator [compost metagenome]|uniref:LysR family transcriptional regulator n=1 Tax=Cupriavidus campinensis TaxID=151783 RepID=A0AAE9HZP6_9BURK|nr:MULTISPECIES: LysR substrate-binding domain-containing protein [Cupriavidus]TSP12507.1 LysR family transcriptional regulator [Cupriavidus campinensis]URF03307.1 LysR substrate-binding domain-containing protein [Cupriavidus campinensis]CAG2151349.1 Hydrogen peroxide-inducible genes activator [Cupriavidus campinensis]
MSTIRFLRTFVAVSEQGSFAAAAGRVALTQAAVSLQMRSLEQELRRELFDRSGRVAVLNADGRELLPQARRLLALYEEMRLPQGGAEDMAGAVAVGAVVSVMGGLSHVVARLKRAYPALDVRLVGAKSIDLAEQVESGELDAAFLVEGSARPAGTLRWTPLYQEPLVAIAARGSPGETAREALAANPFLRFDRSQRTGALVERALRRAHLRTNEFLELNSIEALVELVRQEVGVTVVPQLRLARWHEDHALRLLPLQAGGEPVVRTLGMLERRDHGRAHVTEAIRSACEALFGS